MTVVLEESFRRRWPLLAVVAVALLAACPGAARAGVSVTEASRSADSVRHALSAVSEAGGLTVDQDYGYRRSLRQAMRVMRTLDLPAKERRRDELGSQIVMLAALAERKALTPARMRPLFRQLDANRIWFAASAPPASAARVSVGGDPLVYAYYPGHGLQFQPLFNSSFRMKSFIRTHTLAIPLGLPTTSSPRRSSASFRLPTVLHLGGV